MTVEDSLALVLRHEGGFVDDPDDPGGATNFGITQATLAVWRGHDVTVEEVAVLTADEALDIYRHLYVAEPGLDRLPGLLRPVMIDAAVNHGPAQAVHLLQHVINRTGADEILEDGMLGPATRLAAEETVSRLGAWLVTALVEERRRFYFRLADRRPESAKFLTGWLRRIAAYTPDNTEIA